VLSSIENVLTGSGADTITGDSFDNVLSGGAGNDSYIFLNGLIPMEWMCSTSRL
jgi:Ca2+-binding RTX toxin-like protein